MSDDERKKQYTPNELAALTGVTVRTLHHYDRIGLLQPKRTAAGHRRYCASDVPALREVGALKAIGVSLKEIAAFRKSGGETLAIRIRERRRILEDGQQLTARLIQGLKSVEQRLATPEGQHMDGESNWLGEIAAIVAEEREQQEWRTVARAALSYRRALSDETKARWDREWTALLQAIQPRLDDEPAAPAVQALAARWLALARSANPTVPIETILRVGQSTMRWAARYSPGPTEMRRSMDLLTRAAMLQLERR